MIPGNNFFTQIKTKKWLIFLIIATLLGVATLLLNTNPQNEEPIPVEEEEEQHEKFEREKKVELIDESNFSVSITTKPDTGDKIIYTLSVVNKGQNKDTLNYSTDQLYDYTIITSQDDKVYHYSENTTSEKKESTKELEPEGHLTHDIDVTEVFSKLPDGSYTLEFQSTAKGVENLKTSITRSKKSESVLDKTQEEIVTFASLGVEGNSFEGLTEDGIRNNYFLETEVKPIFTKDLKKGTKVKITYNYVGQQRMVIKAEVQK